MNKHPPPINALATALHALARENAEALNALLTREIPVMTQQLQQTMELMNQLIRRQFG